MLVSRIANTASSIASLAGSSAFRCHDDVKSEPAYNVTLMWLPAVQHAECPVVIHPGFRAVRLQRLMG